MQATQLWYEICRNCHSIVLARELARRYNEHLRTRRSRLADWVPIPGLEKAVRQAIHGKAQWVDDAEPTSEERLIRHQNDQFLARIAIRCPGCIVVSAERSGQTLEDFRRAEFSSQGIRALDVEEALGLAQQPASSPASALPDATAG